MKRAKILTTILAFVLGATTIIFGACTTSLTANCATLNLNKPRDVNATITAQITGAKADANNNNLATSPALGTVGADGTVSKTIYSYNSDGSQQPLLSTWGIGKIYFSKSTE
ncbi:MAG: hypothetical protein RR008_04130, partial [Clostridia bacterium]